MTIRFTVKTIEKLCDILRSQVDDVRRWLGQLGNPFERIGQDLDGRVSIEWGVYGVPETFVVDRLIVPQGTYGRHEHAAEGSLRLLHACVVLQACY